MSTIVNKAVSAIVSVLQSAPALAGIQIGRVSLRPVAQAAQTAVIVRPLQSDVSEASQFTSMPVSWVTAIAVDCYARSSTSTTPDLAVDALLESVYAALMADPTLGGVVLGLQPQNVAFDFDADGDKTACATLVFHARHRASPGLFS